MTSRVRVRKSGVSPNMVGIGRNRNIQSGVARVINLDYLVAGHHIVAQNFSLRHLM